MFGKETEPADTKDFIKVSGKSGLSDCLDHTLNHLDTSLYNDLGVDRSSCFDFVKHCVYPKDVNISSL